jgi:hypothetical protein
MSDEADAWLREQWRGWVESGIRMAYRPNAHYVSGYAMPWLNTQQFGEFFRFTIQNGSEGVHFGSNSLGNWSLRGPMHYMLMRLAWDGEQTPGDTMDHYLDAFGPAAEAVGRYFDHWERWAAHHHWSSRPKIKNVARLFPPQVFRQAERYLDAAKAATRRTEHSRYRKRVQFLRHGFEHARLARQFAAALDNGTVPLDDREDFKRAKTALEKLISFRRKHAASYFVDLFKLAKLETNVEGLSKLFKPFEMVREAGLPNALDDPWDTWRFRKDPDNRGVERGWHRRMPGGTVTQPMPVPAHWGSTRVGGYLGYGWYWTRFKVPANWTGRPVHLRFEAVDEQAWVYLNGQPAGEHSLDSQKDKTINDLWNEPFTVRMHPDQVNYGGQNLLAVRVHASQGNGGIWKPVTVYCPK